MQTYYQVLGVHRQSSFEEVKAHYRQLARERHPDVGTGEDMTEINKAYETLSNFTARNDYDIMLKFTRHMCIVCNGEGVIWKQQGFHGRVATPCVPCQGVGSL